MKNISVGNFQVGIVDDPSIEGGGFEFASGMDIFSEPGVMKANFAMTPVSGLTPTTYGFSMKTTSFGGTLRGYMAVGSKIYTSTDGINWSLFLTGTKGTIENLEIFNGYIFYACSGFLGRVEVNNAASQNDTFQTFTNNIIWYPMTVQGGTLKIGDGRYIMSIDEASSITTQAMKAPADYLLWTMAPYQNRLFIGSALFGGIGYPSTEDATVFDWSGTVLSSGAALPDSTYPLYKRGMGLLLATGQGLFGFPDRRGEIYVFDGAKFVLFRQLTYLTKNDDFRIRPFNGCEHLDTVLFTGDNDTSWLGIYQMKGGVINQSFVPSAISPGSTEVIYPTFLASGFDGKVYFSYQRVADSSYHIDYLSTNRQNGAIVRTTWHRGRVGRRPTDQFKRWGGVKLNMKPLAPGCSVKVEYRTERNAAFTDPGVTIDSTNQERPAVFSAQPRSREIQFRFTFTTSGTNTPELFTYDYLFEVLNSLR